MILILAQPVMIHMSQTFLPFFGVEPERIIVDLAIKVNGSPFPLPTTPIKKFLACVLLATNLTLLI
jgi:hypothetical protein